ncbi:MAG: hypothetical protein NTY70_11510 [Burkholderiales bacterium]|nr:hypothetical protein [Burkholderiales bacterium]
MQLLNLILLMVLAATSGHARADWIDPGVAYRCDKAAGVFGMMATMATSSPETAGEVQAGVGYVALSKENDELLLSCRVGEGQAKAIIRIVRAREHGRCSAFDYLQIVRLEVNEKVLFEYEQFSSCCYLDPVLNQVELRAKGEALSLKTCRAAWMWDTGYSPETCEERMVPIHMDVKKKVQ